MKQFAIIIAILALAVASCKGSNNHETPDSGDTIDTGTSDTDTDSDTDSDTVVADPCEATANILPEADVYWRACICPADADDDEKRDIFVGMATQLITGLTGHVKKGSFTECHIVAIREAVITSNVFSEDEDGAVVDPQDETHKILSASGMHLDVIATSEPVDEDGAYIQRTPALDIELNFSQSFGTPVRWNTEEAKLEMVTDATTVINPDGLVGTRYLSRHFSDIFVVNRPFDQFEVNFVSNEDGYDVNEDGILAQISLSDEEQETFPSWVAFKVLDGTEELQITQVDGQPSQVRIAVYDGAHDLSISVSDVNEEVEYRHTAEVQALVDLTVDLCADNSCEEGSFCDAATGNCVCLNSDGWSGTYPNCEFNECFGVECIDNATCDETDGECYCDEGFELADDVCEPIPCYGVVCGANATCDVTDDQCYCNEGFYSDNGVCETDMCYNVTCDDGQFCNGAESCDQATGCLPGLDIVCEIGGICDETADACVCDADSNFSGTYPDCINDACLNVTCEANATCNASGICECNDGYFGEADDCQVDLCFNVTCDDGVFCNGAETNDNCDPATGCLPATPVDCGTGATCDTDLDACICDNDADYSGTYPACTHNACLNVTCGNNEQCNTSGECECADGFIGDPCVDFDACASNPCFIGVSCTDQPAPSLGYTCGSCPSGYSGDGETCTDNNECVLGTHDCNSHEQCVNSIPGFTCECLPGYTGVDCGSCASGFVPNPLSPTECIDDTCAPDPCNGNATSCTVDGPSAFTCSCETGYDGDTCDLCDEANGYFDNGSGECVNPCEFDSCNQNGDCEPTGPDTFTCDCNTGYSGPNCSDCDTGYADNPLNPSECIDDPCLPDPCNGHANSCTVNGPSSYTCNCENNYDGSTCNTCAVGYENYPTCSADVTAPSAPVITTCSAENSGSCPTPPAGWSPAQASVTVNGTCDGSDTAIMQYRYRMDGGSWTSWTSFSYSSGSNNWSWSGTLQNEVVYTFEFHAMDFAGGNASGADSVIIEPLW